jgi:hypothetical protein
LQYSKRIKLGCGLIENYNKKKQKKYRQTEEKNKPKNKNDKLSQSFKAYLSFWFGGVTRLFQSI